MTSPISNLVSGIFIHVSDLERSTSWYGQLLGLPLRPEDRFDHIHVFVLRNGTHLILDAKGFTPRIDESVLFMFDTPDAEATKQFLVEHGVEVIRDIENAGPVSFLNFRDPDGNVLMACQQHG